MVQKARLSCLGDRLEEDKEKYKMISSYLCCYCDFFLFSHFSWVSGQMALPVQKSKITKHSRRGNIKKVKVYENP